LGIVNRRLGRYAEAEHHRGAVAIHREVDDLPGEGRALGNLGFVEMGLGAYDAAREHHTRSLEIHRERGDRADEAVSLTNLGAVLERLGRYPEALDHHERALAIYHDIGYRIGEADALHGIGIGVGIGIVRRRAGRPDQATDPLRDAIATARESAKPT